MSSDLPYSSATSIGEERRKDDDWQTDRERESGDTSFIAQGQQQAFGQGFMAPDQYPQQPELERWSRNDALSSEKQFSQTPSRSASLRMRSQSSVDQHAPVSPYDSSSYHQAANFARSPSSSSTSIAKLSPTSSAMSTPLAAGLPAQPNDPSPAPMVSTHSSSSSSSSNKGPRARVNMACIHCRSRKIRCNGQQPSCATCTRLKRACHYESISEEENIAVREKKKQSRDAKQARLRALSQLGVPVPRRPVGHPSAFPSPSASVSDHNAFHHQRRRSFGNTHSNTATMAAFGHLANGMTSPSVLRDVRSTSMGQQQQQAMTAPSSPFTTSAPSFSRAAHPSSLASPSVFNPPTQQQWNRTWQGQTTSYPAFASPLSSPQHPMPPAQVQSQTSPLQSNLYPNVQPSSMSVADSISFGVARGQGQSSGDSSGWTRRRGNTLDTNVYTSAGPASTISQHPLTGTAQNDIFWRSGSEMTANMNIDPHAGLYDVGSMPHVMSLSQPATPQGTYQFHAQMLSHDLSTSSSGSEGGGGSESLTVALDPSAGQAASLQESTIAAQIASTHGGPTVPRSSNLFSQQASLRQRAAGMPAYSRAPSSSATVTSGMALPVAHEYFPLMPNASVYDTQDQSTATRHEADLQQSTDRSGFPSASLMPTATQEQSWRRATNSDAMVAQFFARVVEARARNPSVTLDDGHGLTELPTNETSGQAGPSALTPPSLSSAVSKGGLSSSPVQGSAANMVAPPSARMQDRPPPMQFEGMPQLASQLAMGNLTFTTYRQQSSDAGEDDVTPISNSGSAVGVSPFGAPSPYPFPSIQSALQSPAMARGAHDHAQAHSQNPTSPMAVHGRGSRSPLSRAGASQADLSEQLAFTYQQQSIDGPDLYGNQEGHR